MAVVRVASTGEALVVNEGDRLFVGTSDGADLTLQDEDVAAIHCVVNAEIGEVTIQDYYSQAGTFVNGQKVSECKLAANAVIRIGNVTLDVEVFGNQEASVETSTGAQFTSADNKVATPESKPPVANSEKINAEQQTTFVHPSTNGETQRHIEKRVIKQEESDTHVATLTGLLKASEETGQAEEGGRRQLMSWLDDIESRFGQRNGEIETQRTGLMTRIESITEERDRGTTAMNSDSSSTTLEAAQNAMIQLREALEEERARVSRYEQQIASLQSELDTAQSLQTQQHLTDIVEQKAEMARQREELEQQRLELRQKANRDAEFKVRALRDHLKEIHTTEQAEQKEKKLGNCIARLWRRFSGH